MSRNHSRRIQALECHVTQQRRRLPVELAELHQAIGEMSRAERIAFVEEWLATTGVDSDDWRAFLTDWRDFLKLQGTPTWPDFDRETMKAVETPASLRWHELHQAHYRWGGWTGWGLPPELREE